MLLGLCVLHSCIVAHLMLAKPSKIARTRFDGNPHQAMRPARVLVCVLAPDFISPSTPPPRSRPFAAVPGVDSRGRVNGRNRAFPQNNHPEGSGVAKLGNPVIVAALLAPRVSAFSPIPLQNICDGFSNSFVATMHVRKSISELLDAVERR